MIDAAPYKQPGDPYADELRAVTHPCVHGHGDNCECQLPEYRGLYVAPIDCKDGIRRHVVATMQLAHDGGMISFRDPVSGDVVGSCGIHFMWDQVHTLEWWSEFHG